MVLVGALAVLRHRMLHFCGARGAVRHRKGVADLKKVAHVSTSSLSPHSSLALLLAARLSLLSNGILSILSSLFVV